MNFEDSEIAVRHTVIRLDKELHKLDATKTKSSNRVLPLVDTIRKEFELIQARQAKDIKLNPNYINEGYIFTKPNGEVLNPNFVTKKFRQILKGTKFEGMRLHDLRHSAASYLRFLGCDLKQVSEWLGHSDTYITANLYQHLYDEEKQEIANQLENKFSKFAI